jgi:hypothetical protein
LSLGLDGNPPGALARRPARRPYDILTGSLVAGEVAESAEGSRLLSGYRGKTSVQGSNPCLSAISLPAPRAVPKWRAAASRGRGRTPTGPV